jgi:ATP-dependent Lhr-like helicase
VLWDVNEENLPIGIHHGSLSREARAKVERRDGAGRLRALVCTASIWGWIGAMLIW